MRNLLTLISLCIVLSLSAQDVDTKLSRGGSFEGLGKQGDTLVTSGTVNYVLELDNEVYGTMRLAIENTTVTGDCEYTAYLQKSLNGTSWLNVDTAAYIGGSSAYVEFDAIGATHPYYRVNINANSTAQKSNIEIWGRINEGFLIEN